MKARAKEDVGGEAKKGQEEEKGFDEFKILVFFQLI